MENSVIPSSVINICIIRCSKEEKRGKDAENLLEEITAENFPNICKEKKTSR